MKGKRFIAGAVCPECREADKIYIYLDENQTKWRACVNCDFLESMGGTSDKAMEEIPTRVNQHRPGEQPLQHETPVERVKFVDVKKEPGT